MDNSHSTNASGFTPADLSGVTPTFSRLMNYTPKSPIPFTNRPPATHTPSTPKARQIHRVNGNSPVPDTCETPPSASMEYATLCRALQTNSEQRAAVQDVMSKVREKNRAYHSRLATGQGRSVEHGRSVEVKTSEEVVQRLLEELRRRDQGEAAAPLSDLLLLVDQLKGAASGSSTSRPSTPGYSTSRPSTPGRNNSRPCTPNSAVEDSSDLRRKFDHMHLELARVQLLMKEKEKSIENRDRSTIKQLTADNAALQEEITSLRAASKGNRGDSKGNRGDSAASSRLKDRILELEADKAMLSKGLDEQAHLQVALHGVIVAKQQCELEIERMGQEISELKVSSNTVPKFIEKRIEVESEKQQKTISTLSTENSRLNDEMKCLRDANHELTVQTETLQRGLSEAHAQIHSLQAQLEEQNASHSSLQAQQQQVAKQQALLRARLAGLSQGVGKVQQERAQLRGLCEALPGQVKEASQLVLGQVGLLVQRVSQRETELGVKYRKEMALRKQYHNELLELKGNIRVFCRVRPPITEDSCDDDPSIVVTYDPDDEDIVIVSSRKGRGSQQFALDKVFTPSSTQSQVFEEVNSLVISCVDGYNVCIFAYGQTGSGKTYTMEGPIDDPGINQRALTQLFEQTRGRSSEWEFTVEVSAIEIYNEILRDLLVPAQSNQNGGDKLEIKMSAGDGSLHVPGLTWVTVESAGSLNEVFSRSKANRATESTRMNEQSSRSHALLCVRVKGVNKHTGAQSLGRLNLVDLAGSERVSRSGADGARLKEAQNINRSLSSLSGVIAALRSKQNHVPYRNSKLTYLLQDSLGGDSKTLMIVQVAPVESHAGETICSLNFAQRVHAVELGTASRHVTSATASCSGSELRTPQSGSRLQQPSQSRR